MYSNLYYVAYQQNLLCILQCKYECMIENQAFIICNERTLTTPSPSSTILVHNMEYKKKKEKVKIIAQSEKHQCTCIRKTLPFFKVVK